VRTTDLHPSSDLHISIRSHSPASRRFCASTVPLARACMPRGPVPPSACPSCLCGSPRSGSPDDPPASGTRPVWPRCAMHPCDPSIADRRPGGRPSGRRGWPDRRAFPAAGECLRGRPRMHRSRMRRSADAPDPLCAGGSSRRRRDRWVLRTPRNAPRSRSASVSCGRPAVRSVPASSGPDRLGDDAVVVDHVGEADDRTAVGRTAMSRAAAGIGHREERSRIRLP